MPKHHHTRRLPGGREVDVGRNGGLRKLCNCGRRHWTRCPHSYALNFTCEGEGYRFSLDRHFGRHIGSKTEAQALADSIRVAIRAGTFRPEVAPEPGPALSADGFALTFEQLAQRWLTRERNGKVPTAADDGYRVKRLGATVLPEGGRLGEMAVTTVTEDDIEHAVDAIRQRGAAASTLNHYIQTVKTLERWGVRKRHMPQRWLSEHTSLRRKKSAQRNRRLVPDVLDLKGNIKEPGEERRLLSTANPWMQRLIIAALDTGCRRGELLSLQWADVNLTKGEVTIRPEKAKTGRRRVLPISTRLRGVLTMIQTGPDGEDWPPTAYVFGNELGEQVGNPKTAWQICVLRAHGYQPSYRRSGANCLDADGRAKYRHIDLHFHDLRHEAGSRLVEAGWPLHHVQEMLGHTNLKTTSTYLNITATGLAESMRRYGTLQVVAKSPDVEPQPSGKAEALSDSQVLVN